MRVFYDTEFIDDGRTIDLVSIGMVKESGEEYYAVSSEFDVEKLHANKWLVDHVWPHLPLKHPPAELCQCLYGHLDRADPAVKPRAQIAADVQRFLIGEQPDVKAVHDLELWAWYAAYDHVALAQLWGPMIGLPPGIPMYTHDLRQEVDRLERAGLVVQLPDQASGEHNALADARHNVVRARYLDTLATAP